MDIMNQTGKRIFAAGERAPYDTEAINIVKDKQYLALILSECTTEFAGMSMEEIIPCIEEPQVGAIPVEPGLTNTVIAGLPTESKIPGEGVLTYDIRFLARKPGMDAVEIWLMIDVEIQNDDNPGYDFVPRAVLYAGRMLSEQMGQNVNGRNYDALQKVYSIWLCANSALKRANTISRYSIKHEALHGDFEDQARSDLLQVIMVRLPNENLKDNPKNEPTRLIEMLSTTFSRRIGTKEKLRRLQQMGIQVTEDIRERIGVMCNLSQGILKEGIEQGIEKGIEKGIEQGLKQGLERGLNLSLDILDRRDEYPGESLEETAEAVGCALEDVQAVVNRRMRFL